MAKVSVRGAPHARELGFRVSKLERTALDLDGGDTAQVLGLRVTSIRARARLPDLRRAYESFGARILREKRVESRGARGAIKFACVEGRERCQDGILVFAKTNRSVSPGPVPPRCVRVASNCCLSFLALALVRSRSDSITPQHLGIRSLSISESPSLSCLPCPSTGLTTRLTRRLRSDVRSLRPMGYRSHEFRARICA